MTKGSMGITDKSKPIIGSQVSGGNNTDKVPTGLFYWFGEGETPVFLLMDHHGEFFLIQKGKVHWSHKTNIEMYSLFVSDGVNDYLDAGEDMFSYRHTPGLPPKVISHDSLEDLREKLERIYGNGIRATSKLVELDLDYQTGEVSDESTSERFIISIIIYEVLLSSPEPPTLRWHLVFGDVSAVFPNTDFSCMVLYTRNLDEFREICQKFDIKTLPGGRTIEELYSIKTFRKKMISVDPKAEWKNNTTKGIYDEGVDALVIRIKKRTNIFNTIKKVRHQDIDENVLRYYGWQEESDFYFLAFEMCEYTLEDYLTCCNFTNFDGSTQLRLDILRGFAKGVFSLQRQQINHGNLRPNNVFIKDDSIAKLGPCRFVLEEEKDEHKGGSLSTNLQDFAKLLLYCTSGGFYKFSDQDVQDDELDLCKIAEARDLIQKIRSNRIVNLCQVLHHPFFWGTLKRISFIGDFSGYIDLIGDNAGIVLAVEQEFSEKKFFENTWDSDLLDKFVNAMDNHRIKWGLPDYNYKEGKSLLRFMNDAFNHYKSLGPDVLDEIGSSKCAVEIYLRATFPGLLISLYNAGLPYRFAIPNLLTYYLEDTNFRQTGLYE